MGQHLLAGPLKHNREPGMSQPFLSLAGCCILQAAGPHLLHARHLKTSAWAHQKPLPGWFVSRVRAKAWLRRAS